MHPHAALRKRLKSCSTVQIHHGIDAVTPALAAALLDGLQVTDGALVLNSTFRSGRRALPWRTYAVLHLLVRAGAATAAHRAALTRISLSWEQPTDEHLDLRPLQQLPALRALTLHNAEGLSALPELTLESLSITGASTLPLPAVLRSQPRRLCLTDRVIDPSLLPADLAALTLTRCTGLDAPCVLPTLTHLSLRKCPDLSALTLPETLATLQVHDCPELTTLALSSMERLQRLDAPDVVLTGQSSSSQLTELRCAEHAELGPQSALALEHLYLAKFSGVDLSLLAGSTKLRSLTLKGAEALRDLSALSGSAQLEELTITEAALTTTQSLPTLPKLKTLTLRDASALHAVDGLGGLPALTELDLSGSALDNVDGLQGCPALTHLRLSGCRGLDQIHGLRDITTLQELLLPSSDGRWSARYVETTLAELQARLHTDAEADAALHMGGPMVTRLRKLLMHEDIHHQRQALEVMRSFGPQYARDVLCGCQLRSDGMIDVPFGQLSESLLVAMIDAGLVPAAQEQLSMKAGLLASLAFVKELPKLRTLTLTNCLQLTTLHGLEHATNLESLTVEVCPELADISALRGLRSLRRLVITMPTSSRGTLFAPIQTAMLEDSLRGLVRLEELRIDRCSPLPLAVLSAFPQLKVLSAPALSPGQGFARLSGLSALEDIELYEARELEDLNALRRCTKLRRLVLGSSNRLRDLRPLAGLTELTELIIGGEQITDLSPLANLSALAVVGLNEARGVSEIAALGGLTQLRELVISGASRLKDVRPLRGLGRLEQLGLQDLPGLQTLDGLEGCPALHRLELVACTGLQCAAALSTMTQLTTLEVDRLSAVAPGLTSCHKGTPRELWRCRNQVYSELQHRTRVIRRDLTAAAQSGDAAAVMAELDILAEQHSEQLRDAVLADIDKERGQWGVLSAAPLPLRERALARLVTLLD